MGRKQCRLWWPKNLLSCEPSSDLLLFGWFAHYANSVDVVVAHASSVPEFLVHLGQLELQEILQSINLMMPVPLQEAPTFCMVGHCAVHCRNADMETMRKSYPVLKSTLCHGVVENAATKTIKCEDINESFKGNTSEVASSVENHGSWSCGCEILNPSMEPRREVLNRYGNWIQLLYKSQGILCKKSRWVPEFHHMHQNGHFMSNCDVHLVLCEPPTYGRHHFSGSSWGYHEQEVTPSKKPSWFNELHKKSADPNLEAVAWALDCASASMLSFKGILSARDHAISFCVISRSLSML